MSRYFALLISLCFAAAAPAASVPDDFAYRAALEPGDGELQRIELPVEVMLALTRADLRDLAVFNIDGKPLPLAVLPVPRSQSELRLALPFHEFSRFQENESKTVTTREQNRNGDDLTEIEVTRTVTTAARRRDYLIELQPDSDTPRFDRVELVWRHEPADQLLELRVETGNSLDALRVLQQRKTLTDRKSDDVSWRSIGGIPRQHKYLRLTPAERIQDFELLEAVGLSRQTGPAPILTHRLRPEAVEVDGERLYRFSLPSRVQPVSLRILPGEAHSAISGDLWGGDDNFAEARRIHYGFRQHNFEDPEIKPSAPLQLLRRYYPVYWFSLRDHAGRTPPEVELHYAQHEVMFLGDGRGPYSLYWGNHEFVPPAAGLTEFLDGDLGSARERSTLARIAAIEEAGGLDRLTARTSLPWQKWLLWVVLIAAALVTGRMALNLYREMNRNPD